MADIRLVDVYGERFRSFEAPFRVSFPATGSVLIRGINRDSQDSSASGKSSLVLALAQVFGGCPFPGTELATWGHDSYSVGANLQVGDLAYKIDRSTSGLRVVKKFNETDDADHRGRAAEAELTKLFGLPPELRAAVTYRGQGKKSIFLNLPDQKIKELLTAILDLQPYLTAAQAAQEAVRGLRKEVDAAKAKWDNLKEIHESAKAKLAELPADDGPDPADEVAAAEQSLEVVDRKLEDLTTKENDIRGRAARAVEAALKQIEAEAPEIASWDEDPEVVTAREAQVQAALAVEKAQARERDRKAAFEKERNELKLQETSAKGRIVAGVGTRMQQLGEQKKALEEALCPTCEREWVDEKAAVKLAEVEEAIAGVSKLIESNKEAQKEVSSIQAKLQALGSWFEPSAEVEGLSLRHTVACKTTQEAVARAKRRQADAVADLEARKKSARSGVESQLGEALAKIAGIRSKLKAERVETVAVLRGLQTAAADHAALVAQRRHQTEAVDNFDALRVEAGFAYTDAQKKLDAELDFLALVGREGFVGAYPDDTLDEITAETNVILGHVANVRHVAFSYISERENGSGNLERRIVPMVTIEGATRPFESGLSGGMQSAVGLAVDLGWRSVIRRKAGSHPSWCVLDEAFDGLGAKAKETCLEMLQTYGNDSLFLVVDHSSEMQSFFSDVIEIESEGGRSRVVSGLTK